MKSHAFFLASAYLLCCTLQDLSNGLECKDSTGERDRTIKISLKSGRNETGEWMDTLLARAEATNTSNHFHFDVTHSAMDCGGKRVVYIEGIAKDLSVDGKEERLSFHPRCGKNVAIDNNGITAQKIDDDEANHSVLFTNRPLRNGEIFEVRIDKKITKYNFGSGIGVTTVSPAVVEIPDVMYKSPNGWMYHATGIMSGSKKILNYKAKNIDQLQVGDRIGVMRNDYGVLHFFVNGIDQGPAVSNVPQTVYGVFDLRYNDIRATIV